jgi:hypothetical protein
MTKKVSITKKVLALLLAGSTIFSMAACGGDKHGEAVPTYTSDKEFYIGMWVGVPSSMKTYDPDTGEVLSEGRPLTDEEFDNHYKLLLFFLFLVL